MRPLTTTSFWMRRQNCLSDWPQPWLLDCAPCRHDYLAKAKDAGIKRGEISEVLAKVMAVSAGQKRLQFEDVTERFGIDLSEFE